MAAGLVLMEKLDAFLLFDEAVNKIWMKLH